MESLIVQPEREDQMNALKAFLKALNIKFQPHVESPYKPEFVAKVLQGKEDIKNGKGTKIKLKDLWK